MSTSRGSTQESQPWLPLDGVPGGTQPAGPCLEGLASTLRRLADRGVYVGTSSWKYPGWVGQVYRADRYQSRGRFSERIFNDECLEEYATIFPTVCVDAAYYRFPERHLIAALVDRVPAHFRFAFKVTDTVTLRRFPRLGRYGERAGTLNPEYLDADRFGESFIGVMEPFRPWVGVLIFEFARCHGINEERLDAFVEELDRFLGKIPTGWPYGVEIRTPSFLDRRYFAVLRQHRVTHVYNSWEAMPAIHQQWALAESHTAESLTAARFLLRPGRRYADAVRAFRPYRSIQDIYPEGRSAGATIVRAGRDLAGKGQTFVFVNNRFEGNAPDTIASMLAEAGET